jgi:hypothetical protein
LTNLQPVTAGAAATGGLARCELVDGSKSGALQVSLPKGWTVGQVILSYFTIGTGGRVLVAAPRVRSQTINTRQAAGNASTALAAAATPAGVSVWSPQLASFSLPSLPDNFRITLQPTKSGRLGWAHLDLRLIKAPEALKADATLKRRPRDVTTAGLVPLDMSQARAAVAAASALTLADVNASSHGRKLMRIPGASSSFVRGLKTNFPKFLKRLNDGLENANQLWSAYMDVMGDMMGGEEGGGLHAGGWEGGRRCGCGWVGGQLKTPWGGKGGSECCCVCKCSHG